MNYYRSIDAVVEALKNMEDLGVKCNLLIGAGCSVSAGIPSAQGILDIIQTRYPDTYSRASEKNYATCMKMLTPGERRGLIKNLISGSKLNMTHIAIAQLIKNGFIHRVLTPNFDNLLIRALSFVDEFPPIYDLASSTDFTPSYIPEKSIFYLHGQYTGLKLMNTVEEVESQTQRLKPLFDRLKENSVWLIVGYSGQNDSLFKLLSDVPEFENRLFWVGYNETPGEHLGTNLLSEDRYAFYLRSYDSDSFFVELAERLGQFPPNFMLKPFSYLKNLITNIEPNTTENDLLPAIEVTSNVIEQAIDTFENKIEFMAEYYYRLGLYDNILLWERELIELDKVQLVANSYFRKGYKTHIEARKIEMAGLIRTALDYYGKSNELEEDSDTYNNIGVCWQDLWKYEEDGDPIFLLTAIDSFIMSAQLQLSNAPLLNLLLATYDLLEHNLSETNEIESLDKSKIELVEYGGDPSYQLHLDWYEQVRDLLLNTDEDSETLNALHVKIDTVISILKIFSDSRQVAASSED